MFARYVEVTPVIMDLVEREEHEFLTLGMRLTAGDISAAINQQGIAVYAQSGQISACNVDGYASQNMMDDANLSSLLQAAMMGYASSYADVYQNTRLFVFGEQISY